MKVPKLRFKEFTDKWEEKKLGEVFKIGNGKDYKNLNIGDIPVYGTGGLITNVDDFLYDGESVGIGRKGTINKPLFLTGKFWTVDTLFYTYDFKNLLPKFLYYIFNNIDWLTYNEATGVPSLSKSTILKISNFFPCLEEQKKIADFLSSIDKKISITEEKLNLFEEYKKGIMQKIFNQKLRFKDENGNDYPEWEEKILGDISSFTNGKGHEQFIKENGKYIVVNSKFISSNGAVKKYTSNLLVPLYINDILMVMSDVPNGKAIGKCFLVNENDKYSLNQRICALRTNENSKYLYYFLNRNSYFLKFDDGISQTNLKKDEVLNCPVFLPCLEEQKKIAYFLSAIDTKIEKLSDELENLKEFKKGLLQQMFI